MGVMDVREAIRSALREEMVRDPNVFIIGEEVAEYDGAYKVTKGLLKEFGSKRVVDTPICEAGFAGLAIGAAMAGLRPVVEFMSFNFSFVAFDQIVSNAAKIQYMTGGKFQVPIVFRGPNGAGPRVSCQHSHCVAALYSHFPGLKVVAPYTGEDYKGLLKSAIRTNSPVLFLEHELEYNTKWEIPEKEFLVPIGKGRILKEGEDLTIVSFGRPLKFCLEARDFYLKKGVAIEIVDLRTVRPLDIGIVLESLKKTHKLLIVEEGHRTNGVGAEIAAQVARLGVHLLDAPVGRIAQRETPLPYAANLEALCLPSTERIIDEIKTLLRI
ncbi:MAG: pyruvate dehydrogenase complex E1 component subunit beta [Chlamydiae bacterium]|nr:pyruvate dehydrogenase complex E1 component subunit beta [Chlamydiota bacterium]